MILSTDTIHLVLLALLVTMLLIQAWYWLGYYRRAAFAKPGKAGAQTDLPPLSVVICARNEAENLSRFLPDVLKQDYPSFEVVVVNDCSEDNTFDVLGSLMKQYPAPEGLNDPEGSRLHPYQEAGHAHRHQGCEK